MKGPFSLLLLLLSLAAFASPFSLPEDGWAFSSEDLDLPIRDFQAVSHPIFASGFFGDDLTFRVKISAYHEHPTDLTISLISPSGKKGFLSNRRVFGCPEIFLGRTFDPSFSYPKNQTFFPSSNCDLPLVLESDSGPEDFFPLSEGWWTLEIADSARADEGRLLGWSLEILAGPCAPNPCNGGRCRVTNGGASFTCDCESTSRAGSTCEWSACSFPPKYCGDHGGCGTSYGEKLCYCDNPYSGPTCSDPGPCANYCQNGGNCYMLWGTPEPTCYCRLGFTGTYCEFRTPCADFNCIEGSCAINQTTNLAYCECSEGASGEHCEIPGPCVDDSICNDRGYCYVEEGKAACDCSPIASGQWCELPGPCSGFECENGGGCYIPWGESQPRCYCPSDFIGPTCSEPNPCHELTCKHGYCAKSGDLSWCDCSYGWVGEHCDMRDSCNPSPCYSGVCSVQADGSPHCNCTLAYVGELCDQPTPCSFLYCGHGQCVEQQDGETSCECEPGYFGPTCLEHHPCGPPNPCFSGGVCSVTDGAISCECPLPYTGQFCQLVANDPCTNPKVCQNGASCFQVGGSTYCTCRPGFEGQFCQNNINDCPAESPCKNGGKCVDGVNSFSCNCSGTGYEGEFCQINLNACPAVNPCKNGGKCVEGLKSYSCDCSGTGYEGEFCGSNVNDCPAENPCKNGGRCVDGLKSFRCDCSGTGFEGERCGTNVDDCQRSTPTCYNGGRCVDGLNSFSCDCSGTGFTGPTCLQRATCSASSSPELNAYWPTVNTGSFSWGTCAKGFAGEPKRECLKSGLFGPVINPCVDATIQCAQVPSYAFATWPTTFVGQLAKGSCLPWYSGKPERRCRLDGSWDTSVGGIQCSRNRCAGIVEDHATWPQKLAGEQTYGTCLSTHTGRPFRSCQDNGTYGPISNPCTPIATGCAQENYGNALWPATSTGATATGSCDPGFSGFPLRKCELTGVWSTLLTNHCTKIPCPAITEGNAKWNLTSQNTKATGSCQPGFIGTPTRMCNSLGQWQAISNPCREQGDCPRNLFARANWEQTAPGATATGVCITGWTGAPRRICKSDGTWQDLVVQHCTRI